MKYILYSSIDFYSLRSAYDLKGLDLNPSGTKTDKIDRNKQTLRGFHS